MAFPKLAMADVLADPDSALARAREQGMIAEADFASIVVRYEGVRAVLQDARLKPSFAKFLEQMGITSGPFYEWMSRSPLNMDGDEHRRWRQLLMRVFTPRSVERLRPYLRAEAHRLIDGFGLDHRREADFVGEFARHLPALGLCELIGVPKEDREQFSEWADTIGLGFNAILLPARIGDIDDALVQLRAYAQQLIVLRRSEPRDDLVTRLAQAADEAGGMGDDYLNGTLAGLVFAGHETTKNQLGWMVVVLSAAAEEWEAVSRDPSRAKDVIEEVLRFRSAVTSVARTASQPLELFGARIEPGTLLMASLWSANRDARAFPSPDQFAVDANREAAQIAFGQGAHHCLGAALARAELQEGLVALTSRLHCPELLPGATYLPPLGINGPLSLPVRWRAR